MKIISWNCNGKFRDKFKEIIELDADIYVIQECENPEMCRNSDYKMFAQNYIWIGDNKNKGIGIFAKKGIKLNETQWKSYCLKYFVSVNVNNKFDLLGVWACAPYIEEYYIYQNINKENYSDKTVIIGDFNSNKIWDKGKGNRNHSQVVKELNDKGLVSAYHYMSGEKQGNESQKTFFLYRHLDRGYHIDHCFVKSELLKNYKILYDEKWLEFSDHIPIMLEMY